MPTLWARANFVTTYKKKGRKSDCGNHRGPLLFDVAGKFFAEVLRHRFNTYMAEKILLECQSGVRMDRSTTFMIFFCRQILKKSLKQQEPVSMRFVDLKKAFDMVNKDMVFAVLGSLAVLQIIWH